MADTGTGEKGNKAVGRDQAERSSVRVPLRLGRGALNFRILGQITITAPSFFIELILISGFYLKQHNAQSQVFALLQGENFNFKPNYTE